MKLLFNGNLIEEPIPWSINDRGFLYGDGFFETMLWVGDQIPLASKHLNRVKRAASIFKMKLPESDFRFLEENTATLIQLNELSTDKVKARLMIWRRRSNSAGYRTTEEHANWALTVMPHDRPPVVTGQKVGISTQVKIASAPWSGSKSMNALPYVMASMECQERQLDDLVLPSQSGMAAECIESNLFWMDQQGEWNTPDAATGCVQGIMRAYLMEKMTHEGIVIKETLKKPGEIKPLQAFVCNATGIRTISEFNGARLEEDPDRLSAWMEELWKP